MTEKTDNSEVLCPVGMEVITDNIISSCGLLGLQHFFHTLPRSLEVLRDFLSVVPPLPFSIYCTVALVQILCKFCVIYYTCFGLNIARRKMQHHTPPPTSIINVCCHAESDFEACKLDEQNFC